jgi:hypothetical protein
MNIQMEKGCEKRGVKVKISKCNINTVIMIYENPNWIKLNWKNFVWVACIVFLNWAVNLAYLVFNSNSLIKIWWLMLNVTNAYVKKAKNKPYPLILFPTAYDSTFVLCISLCMILKACRKYWKKSRSDKDT